MDLNLPKRFVPQRVSLSGTTGEVKAGERRTLAKLDGPDCIRHLWVTMTRRDGANRQCVIRIYFDGAEIPHVEAPVGDFFGVMHGKKWYPLNTPFLSVQAESGYNCYFPMPFATSARIEFEAGEQGHLIYLMADWHRYPDDELLEPRRFCSRWRRECPTERYRQGFLMADADGPGQLLGFVYGVRLIDNTDRWSHGGADNIYLDGEGEHPVYLRGIGGEDTFGTSYGGAQHPPETHLHASLCYYAHEDTGEARPAQRVVGYRFYEPDAIPFQESLHMRFGCMQNDVCATTYWYQEGPVRPFFRMPEWRHTASVRGNVFTEPVPEHFPRGTYDLPLPERGSWWLCGPFGNAGDHAMSADLAPELEFVPDRDYDGLHENGSRWLTEGSRSMGLDRARWVRRAAHHGFIDFLHAFQPHARGVTVFNPGAAIARAVIHAPSAETARVRLAWDDRLILRVNDHAPMDLGTHPVFRPETIDVPLKAGDNTFTLKLSNQAGLNHGGWAFSFRCQTRDGRLLRPQSEASPDRRVHG